ncbi:MAG: aldo/keto reductase [Alphaproteobacteria bacterium]|nr:aldo/keto reductase [Alphaproteobacteria bacterium]
MKRILAGRQVNPIGLGCMSLSHGYGIAPAEELSERLLHRALDLGYDHLDTARIYGLGRNEALVGRALKARRAEFLLASKMGIIADDGPRRIDCKPATIHREIDKSLAALGVDHIDLYYMHRPDFSVPIEDSMGAMAELVRQGKIGAIGLSEMSAATLRRAHAVHPVAAMQTEYSPWTRNVEIAVLETTRELGVTLVAFSPVGRGALCGTLRDAAGLPDKDMRHGMPRFQPGNWEKNLALIDAFAALAAGAGVTPAQLALGWVLTRGEHIVTIPGTTRIDHLEENIARAGWLPGPELVAQVDALMPPGAAAGPRYSEAMQRQVAT